MKKLFLLLLVSALSFGQTRSEIQTQIETIATGVPNTALKLRNVFAVLANGTAQTGDVKEIDVSNAYLLANFDVTGLGTNERLGWAICNGNNGTRNRNGRVGLQYDPSSYATLGAPGGSKDAVVVSHAHNFISTGQTHGSSGTGFPSGTFMASSGNTIAAGNQNKFTELTGVSGTDKNLQPYIVTLFIMKL